MSVSPAGFVVVALAALLLGYLVPALVRRRQAVGDARVPDRFSTSLRLVQRRPSPSSSGTSTAALIRSAPRAALTRSEEQAVNRPPGMAERRVASEARRVAAVRAALAARRAEQAAAARRRLVITVAALVVTVLAWAAVAFAGFQWYLALFPTVVLGATLYLGVRAARAERAEWAQVPESLRTPRPEADSGPSYSPAQLRAHLTASGAAPEPAGGLRWTTDEQRIAVVEVEIDDDAETAAEAEPAPGTWTPVPVPVPTYTLKAPAPARAVAEEVVVVVSDTAPESGDDETPGIDLNAVLARRRAV